MGRMVCLEVGEQGNTFNVNAGRTGVAGFRGRKRFEGLSLEVRSDAIVS